MVSVGREVGSLSLPAIVTSLHRLRAFSVSPAQPLLRQISNRQRIKRPADCVTYTMSLARARPSSFRLLMYAWRHMHRQCITFNASQPLLLPPLTNANETDANQCRITRLVTELLELYAALTT
jgi:hypothetical protein